MPSPPQPHESKDEFLSRCMSYMAEHHSDQKQDQQVATCLSMWRKSHGGESQQGATK